MKRIVWLGLVLTVAATSILQGCIFNPTVKPGDVFKNYKPQDSPENVVWNLQESYRHREIEQYAKLLAPEFIFKLQPQDVLELGTEFYTHDEDSTGTDALFSTNKVSGIVIDLLYTAVEPANDVELPNDAVKIRINQVNLKVDETSGISWQVTDIQDMFFRPGRLAASEDTTKWFLMEWRDIPATLAPGVRPASTEMATPDARTTTWGQLLARMKEAG